MSRMPKPRDVIFRAITALIGLQLSGLLWVSSAGADQTSDEIKLGAQFAQEIESRYRVVTDPATVERLQRVGAAVARVVDRQDLAYKFKILDIPGPNALGIPGGWVYVTKGMMRFVRSDDELAAVLAHECTHVAHRHYFIQQARANQMTSAMIVAVALSVLARSAGPAVGVGMATQGALANYQRDLEREADLTGVSYLTKTSYSPVAMLTLMEHLAQMDKLSGLPDMGIYADHPTSAERVEYIRADLDQRSIPVVRRIPEGYLKLSLDPATPESDHPVAIMVDGQPVLTLGATVQGQTPADRAQAIMGRLAAFFNTDPAGFEVRAVGIQDHWSVIGGQTVLFDVTPQDAAYAQVSPQTLAEDIRARLARVIGNAPYNKRY